jgi:hypothetical protein
MQPSDPPEPQTPQAAGASVPGPFRYGCALAVSLVLGLFLCCGLTLVQCLGPGPGGEVQAPPTPGPFTGSVVLSLDGMTFVYPNLDAACRHRRIEVAESETRVVLTAEYDTLDLPYCVRNSVYPVDAYKLGAALASRSIVDGVTGAPVPYFDQRTALRPGAPIPGWPVGPNQPYGQVLPVAADFGGPGAAVLAEVFQRPDPVNRVPAGQHLWIIQVAGGGWSPPTGTATTAVTVRGHPGLAAAGIVVWSENGRTLAVREDTSPQPLATTAELSAVADALVPGEGP